MCTRWEEWARENVDRNALYHGVPRPPASKEPRQCPGCDVRFTPARSNQVWCSPRCRSRDAMREKRLRDASVQRLHQDALLLLVRQVPA